MVNKNELQAIISGKGQVRYGTVIQAIACYLGNGQRTSPETENSKQIKKEEVERLKPYISEHQLWVENIDFSRYVSEGAEQRVYLKDSESVLKLNDAIYYSSWYDYLINLLLHNFFFQDTAYNLIGFVLQDDVMYAVVEQSYVQITQETDIQDIRIFLEANGFVNTKNNDYKHISVGLILEDLHDENVLTKNNILYFIDTVFYLSETFWMS